MPNRSKKGRDLLQKHLRDTIMSQKQNTPDNMHIEEATWVQTPQVDNIEEAKANSIFEVWVSRCGYVR